MVQKILGCNLGGLFPSPSWFFFQKKSAESSVHLYSSPCLINKSLLLPHWSCHHCFDQMLFPSLCLLLLQDHRHYWKINNIFDQSLKLPSVQLFEPANSEWTFCRNLNLFWKTVHRWCWRRYPWALIVFTYILYMNFAVNKNLIFPQILHMYHFISQIVLNLLFYSNLL